MGYKDCISDLMTEWYDLLDGNIEFNSAAVPVYKDEVPQNATEPYILLRAEGETTVKNNSAFFINAIIITEVVTSYASIITRSDVDTINSQITELIFPTPSTYGITNLTNHQVTDIQLQTTTYVAEDADKKYYSKISRYEHFLNQN